MPRKTFSATLPSRNRLSPDRPCVAIVISVPGSASPFSMIVSSARPFSTVHFTAVAVKAIGHFAQIGIAAAHAVFDHGVEMTSLFRGHVVAISAMSITASNSTAS